MPDFEKMKENHEKRSEQSNIDDAGSLTIHGISRISSARTIREKALWILLMASATSFLIYFSGSIIAKYFSRQVYLHSEKRIINRASFPAITFCNTNFMNIGGKDNPRSQKLPPNCSVAKRSDFVSNANYLYFLRACKMFFGNSSLRAATSNGFSPGHIKFPKHFTLLPQIWPCFTLNGDSTIIQYNAGERGGLRMLIYFDENEHSSLPVPNPIDDERQGLYVDIHDPKIPMNGFDGVILTPGFHTHIKIRKFVSLRKRSPFPSRCLKDDEMKQDIILAGKQDIKTCIFNCYFRELYNSCQGIHGWLRAFMSVKKYPKNASYNDPNYLKCTGKFARKFRNDDCKCRLPCREETYETKVSRNLWPQSWQAKFFSPFLANATGSSDKSFTIKEIRRKLIKVSIYYDELSEQVFEEKELYGFSNIVSDFGGQMGLFLGASWLSVIELVHLLFLALKKRFFAKKHQVIVNPEAK